MPRKLRRPKRRIGDDADARRWRMLLTTGWDYFRELRPLGIETNEEARAHARSAWRKHGKALMAAWDADPRLRLPWAFDEFGEP